MAGYSLKPLVAKLDIKPGYRVQLLDAPAGFANLLRPLPEGTTMVGSRAKHADCILSFAKSSTDLARNVATLPARLPPAGLLWIGWPKKAANVRTDLTENVVRALGLATGLVDVKVCALTEVWSGLKFVRRLKDRHL